MLSQDEGMLLHVELKRKEIGLKKDESAGENHRHSILNYQVTIQIEPKSCSILDYICFACDFMKDQGRKYLPFIGC
mgnify:CR=1 FL=1